MVLGSRPPGAGIALYDPQEHRALAFRADRPRVWCLSYAAFALWLLGYPDQALRRSHEALVLAQELSHPPSLAAVLAYVAFTYCYRREAHAAQERAEAAMALASAQGFPQWLAVGMHARAGHWPCRGKERRDGADALGPGSVAGHGAGAIVSHFLVLLAEACGQAEQAEEGLRLLAEALAHMDTTGERYFAAEVYWLKGELLWRQAIPDETQAETCLHQALDIARHQQTRAWELRAAVSLARLWQRQGKRAAAQQMLVEIYGWFTEGFDTVDLQEAKVLLEELKASTQGQSAQESR